MSSDDRTTAEIRELAQLLADIIRRAEYSPEELAEALHQRGVRIPGGYPLRGPEPRQTRIYAVREAIHLELQRQARDSGETYVEITDDMWLIDGGVDLQVLATAVVDSLT